MLKLPSSLFYKLYDILKFDLVKNIEEKKLYITEKCEIKSTWKTFQFPKGFRYNSKGDKEIRFFICLGFSI